MHFLRKSTLTSIDATPSASYRYDSKAFLVNDVQVEGAVFCIGDLYTMWNVKSWQDVTPESLSMLQLFKPAPGKYMKIKSHACQLTDEADLLLRMQIWLS